MPKCEGRYRVVECGVQKTVWCVIWCKQENALKSDGIIWNLGFDIYLFIY